MLAQCHLSSPPRYDPKQTNLIIPEVWMQKSPMQRQQTGIYMGIPEETIAEAQLFT